MEEKENETNNWEQEGKESAALSRRVRAAKTAKDT